MARKHAWLLGCLALALTLGGCAMTGGDDEGGAGATAKNVDSVHMKNGDVLVGELALSEVSVETSYLETVTLETRHLESVAFLADGRVKLETRYGDVVHGNLALDTLRLRSKTGKDLLLPVSEVDEITFAE